MSTSQNADAADESTRYVFVERTKCPVCHSPEIKTMRSEDQGDGSVRRRTTCRTCKHRFFVVVE